MNFKSITGGREPLQAREHSTCPERFFVRSRLETSKTGGTAMKKNTWKALIYLAHQRTPIARLLARPAIVLCHLKLPKPYSLMYARTSMPFSAFTCSLHRAQVKSQEGGSSESHPEKWAAQNSPAEMDNVPLIRVIIGDNAPPVAAHYSMLPPSDVYITRKSAE